MKISEFIKLTINEICDGVIGADKYVAQKTGSSNGVAPSIRKGMAATFESSNIDFEIFISVSENSTSNKEGGMAANISVLNVGGKKTSQKEESKERSAKINFSVPVNMNAFKEPKNQP